jgi:hypothetical protein
MHRFIKFAPAALILTGAAAQAQTPNNVDLAKVAEACRYAAMAERSLNRGLAGTVESILRHSAPGTAIGLLDLLYARGLNDRAHQSMMEADPTLGDRVRRARQGLTFLRPGSPLHDFAVKRHNRAVAAVARAIKNRCPSDPPQRLRPDQFQDGPGKPDRHRPKIRRPEPPKVS